MYNVDIKIFAITITSMKMLDQNFLSIESFRILQSLFKVVFIDKQNRMIYKTIPTCIGRNKISTEKGGKSYFLVV